MHPGGRLRAADHVNSLKSFMRGCLYTTLEYCFHGKMLKQIMKGCEKTEHLFKTSVVNIIYQQLKINFQHSELSTFTL